MTQRGFDGLVFDRLGAIEPERDEGGRFLSLEPQARFERAATSRLHAYGQGPFCRFRIARPRHDPGLYILTRDDVPAYVGECVDVGKRWGPSGYGGISPRNCFEGGQATNCRVNAAILAETRSGRRLDLWFAVFTGPHDMRKAAETRLIHALEPAWNRAKRIVR